jgi:hypothetical protein
MLSDQREMSMEVLLADLMSIISVVASVFTEQV